MKCKLEEVDIVKKFIIGIFIVMSVIIGVGGILIYQYKFEDKLDASNSVDVKNDKDIFDIDGEMIVQFNKDFFDLKDIAKEYVSSRNFDGVSKFSYDLDEDGVVDKISFYKKEKSDACAIELNDKVAVEGLGFNPEFYVVDLNEYDNLVLEIIGLGRCTTDMLKQCIGTRLNEVKVITADSASAYQEFCSSYNIKLQAIPSVFHSDGNINIAEINGIHSQLGTWLSKFRGISIRHF